MCRSTLSWRPDSPPCRFLRTPSLCLYHPLEDSVLQIQPLRPTESLNSVSFTKGLLNSAWFHPHCAVLETLSMQWAWVHTDPPHLLFSSLGAFPCVVCCSVSENCYFICFVCLSVSLLSKRVDTIHHFQKPKLSCWIPIQMISFCRILATVVANCTLSGWVWSTHAHMSLHSISMFGLSRWECEIKHKLPSSMRHLGTAATCTMYCMGFWARKP